MTNKESIIKDIQKYNDAGNMNFKEWMLWGITQLAIMTAMILDNVENMEHKPKTDMREKFCDDFCKYPLMDMTQEDLNEICNECPLVRLKEEGQDE